MDLFPFHCQNSCLQSLFKKGLILLQRNSLCFYVVRILFSIRWQLTIQLYKDREKSHPNMCWKKFSSSDEKPQKHADAPDVRHKEEVLSRGSWGAEQQWSPGQTEVGTGLWPWAAVKCPLAASLDRKQTDPHTAGYNLVVEEFSCRVIFWFPSSSYLPFSCLYSWWFG